MLQLKEIKKDYMVAGTAVHALKGVDISFRRSEFVSVLGPSGCGKTTLLNIIGGLDHYTSGNMYIDGISTEQYKDRDWDTYRNHRIGFVFQSYNLIPHQTILGNVELALNISGVEKSERLKRAKEALDKVGLKDLYNKKPNQLSGGQCQRVAIARALVNEPEILLADEPTGALDSETSVQIMELIKKISKDRLVIMVTHNPELAEKYSTRIVRLLDGEVISDTNPFDSSKERPKKQKETKTAESDGKDKRKSKKSKLSLWSAFMLSAKNLRSKLKRTVLVCLAGSIGIIGVASVLAVSTGVRNYIGDMQNDMLSGNPVTVSEEAFNMSALMSMTNNDTKKDALKKNTEDGYVNVDSVIDYLVSRSGDISSFAVKNDITKEYIDYVKDMPQSYYGAMAFDYGLDLGNNLYTDYKLSDGDRNMSLSAARQLFGAILSKTEVGDYATLISTYTEDFGLLPDNADFILSQYDIVCGNKVASESDEITIVINDESELTDLLLAQYGYYTQDEFINSVYRATEKLNTDPNAEKKYDSNLDVTRFSYEQLMGRKFVWYPNDTVFERTNHPDAQLDALNPFTYNAYAEEDWEGKELKIVSILRPKKGISYGCLSSGFYYTSALASEIISQNKDSETVNYLKNAEQDSFKSGSIGGRSGGIIFDLSFIFENSFYNETGYAGTMSQTNALMSQFMGAQVYYVLSMRDLGGCELPNRISIYPVDFTIKDKVTKYLNEWNSDKNITVGGVTLSADERNEITYTDNLSVIIELINQMIDMVTAALVAFTALSLVVSTVMIAIITYVSVIERVKEIGVIRSLGGRKRDVSALFNAETFIIGLISGVIGILITLCICGIINLIVGTQFGIYTIAMLTVPIAVIMIAVSIALTLVSGLIPAGLAAKKDPVEALRTE